MNKNNVIAPLFASTLYGLCLATINAQAQTPMQIPSSPNVNVSLQQFDRNHFPTFLGAIEGVGSIPDSLFVILTNNADKDIVALNTVWITMDSQGTPHKIASLCEAFSGPNDGVLVRAGARMLLGPNLFLAESLAVNFGRNGYFGAADPKVIQQFADGVQRNPGSRMVVDAMLFSDGSLFGPDLLNVADAIPGKYLAAKAVAAAAQTAIANGVAVSTAMSRLIAEQATLGNGSQARFQARWVRTFGRQMITARSAPGYIRYLQSMKTPPTIRKVAQ